MTPSSFEQVCEDDTTIVQHNVGPNWADALGRRIRVSGARDIAGHSSAVCDVSGSPQSFRDSCPQRPYARRVVIGYDGLERIDMKILRAAGKEAVRDGGTLFETAEFVAQVADRMTSQPDEVVQSLEVLDNVGLLEIRRTLAAGLGGMRSFTLTESGLELHLQTDEPVYPEFERRVITAVADQSEGAGRLSELTDVSDVPILIRAHVVDRLGAEGLITVTKTMGGMEATHFRVISPRLDRIANQISTESGNQSSPALGEDAAALEFIEILDPTGTQDLVSALEPILGLASRMKDDGVFASDLATEDQVQADCAYLHRELYHHSDGVHTAIVVPVAERLMATLARFIGVNRSQITDNLVGEPPANPKDAAEASKAIEVLAGALGEHDLDLPFGMTTRDWITFHLGWMSTAARDRWIESLGVAGSVTTILVALGVTGSDSVLVGSYLGMLSVVFRSPK